MPGPGFVLLLRTCRYNNFDAFIFFSFEDIELAERFGGYGVKFTQNDRCGCLIKNGTGIPIHMIEMTYGRGSFDKRSAFHAPGITASAS